jgi:hypothetical protein
VPRLLATRLAPLTPSNQLVRVELQRSAGQLATGRQADMNEHEQRPTREASQRAAAPLKSERLRGAVLTPAWDEVRACGTGAGESL